MITVKNNVPINVFDILNVFTLTLHVDKIEIINSPHPQIEINFVKCFTAANSLLLCGCMKIWPLLLVLPVLARQVRQVVGATKISRRLYYFIYSCRLLKKVIFTD